MKLYSIPVSNNCRRVNATALQLGLDIEIVEPNFATGEHKQPAYLAINPNGKVPTLVTDDGEVLIIQVDSKGAPTATDSELQRLGSPSRPSPTGTS